MAKLTFSKKQMDFLREGNAYVQPDEVSSSITNIASDINSAKKTIQLIKILFLTRLIITVIALIMNLHLM